MPPKAKNSASSTATGPADDGSRARDAMMVFNSLFHVVNPVVVNIAEIASKTGEKTNTIAKRFSILRKRYPDLNIAATTAGGASNSGVVAAAPPNPPKRKTSNAVKSSASTKSATKVAEVEDDQEEGDDDEADDSIQPYNGAEDTEEEKAKPAASARADVSANPNDTITNANLADDEKSTKKPRAKPAGAKASKPKANTKRKRDENSAEPQPEVKKAKGLSRPKKAKDQAKGPKTKKESGGETKGEDGKQRPPKGADSNKSPADSDHDKCDSATNTAESSKPIREEDLALDIVTLWANRSRQAPISKSPTNPPPKPVQVVRRAYAEDASDGSSDRAFEDTERIETIAVAAQTSMANSTAAGASENKSSTSTTEQTTTESPSIKPVAVTVKENMAASTPEQAEEIDTEAVNNNVPKPSTEPAATATKAK